MRASRSGRTPLMVSLCLLFCPIRNAAHTLIKELVGSTGPKPTVMQEKESKAPTISCSIIRCRTDSKMEKSLKKNHPHPGHPRATAAPKPFTAGTSLFTSDTEAVQRCTGEFDLDAYGSPTRTSVVYDQAVGSQASSWLKVGFHVEVWNAMYMEIPMEYDDGNVAQVDLMEFGWAGGGRRWTRVHELWGSICRTNIC
ncbi:unnamed protein product [Triticum turgidum subsp. durum]|uniref:Uncharacterized protein n=1 Tax=Triticum turgidum subsp. durum TaxID=4567 RepID=A0A9R1QHI9_TRITD|nr:unnamed protein product [Triticum turgidum subsp. durum]